MIPTTQRAVLTHRAKGLELWATWFCVALCGGAAVGAAAAEIAWRSDPRLWVHLALVGTAVATSGLMLGLLVGLRRWRTEVFSDRIVRTFAFKVRTIEKSDVVGYRIIPQQYGLKLVRLFSLSTNEKPLDVPFHPDDERLEGWFADISNLDEVESESLLEALEADTELGATLSERRERLAFYRKLANWGNGAGWAVAAWAWFKPEPYYWAVLAVAAAPWVGAVLIAYSNGRITGNPVRNDPRPQVFSLLLIPTLVLMLRALLDNNVIDWQRAIVLTLIASVLITTAATLALPKLTRGFSAIAWLLVGALIYGGAAVVQANAIFDNSKAQRYQAIVRDKSVSSGKHTAYELSLTAWGPRPAETVEVAKSLFDQTKVGDTVCPALSAGALGIRNFWIGRC